MDWPHFMGLAIFLLLTLTSLTHCSLEDDDDPRFIEGPSLGLSPHRANLIDVLKNLRATTMVDLLRRTKAAETFESSGPYTILVPTDDAFERLPRFAQRAMQSNPKLLHEMLLYHVINGRILSRDLQDEQRLYTLASNRSLGVRLYTDRKPTINQAAITLPDAIASNGVVHVITDVIFPLPIGNLMEVIESCPEFASFKALIHKAELEDLFVQTYRPITVFAPVNAAIKLEKEYLNNMGNISDIQKVVMNHIVSGTKHSRGLDDGQELISDSDFELEVFVRHSKIREVGTGRVVRADIPASNGVIHAIDRLLTPNELCPAI